VLHLEIGARESLKILKKKKDIYITEEKSLFRKKINCDHIISLRLKFFFYIIFSISKEIF